MRLLAQKIKEGFTKIDVEIKEDELETALEAREKKGVTNEFAPIIIEEKEYIIRLNGRLWPPYERKYEADALSVLKRHNIETGVLFNGDEFQICRKPADEFKFSSLLKKGTEAEKRSALQLIGREVVKIHKILHKHGIIYPIHKMVNDAMTQVRNKLLDEQFKDSLMQTTFLSNICHDIIRVLDNQPSFAQKVQSL